MSTKPSVLQQLGFTLIELMVVVAIIGMLLAAGLASYTSVQKTARDGRRIQDVKAIQDALEQYRGVYGTYPTETGGATAAINITALPAATVTLLRTYFASNSLPTFPTGGTMANTGFTPGPAFYEYSTDATGTKYCVCTGVESYQKGNAAGTNTVGACPAAVTPTASSVNLRFCLASQQ